MGWDWVEDACFSLFHCFFEMCVIPKSWLKILFFTLLVYIHNTYIQTIAEIRRRISCLTLRRSAIICKQSMYLVSGVGQLSFSISRDPRY